MGGIPEDPTVAMTGALTPESGQEHFAPGPPEKLCYAPASEIPHPPHTWGEAAPGQPGEPMRLEPRFCDGWAHELPRLTRGLRPGR